MKERDIKLEELETLSIVGGSDMPNDVQPASILSAISLTLLSCSYISITVSVLTCGFSQK